MDYETSSSLSEWGMVPQMGQCESYTLKRKTNLDWTKKSNMALFLAKQRRKPSQGLFRKRSF
jgi:hypothetical protein